MPTEDSSIFAFAIGNQLIGLRLSEVERVLPAAELLDPPQRSPGLSGFLNYRGQVIPILNLREILELPAKELSASDRIIMVRSWNTLLGFFVDEALGVYDIHQMQVISADFEALNIGPAIEGFIQCG